MIVIPRTASTHNATRGQSSTSQPGTASRTGAVLAPAGGRSGPVPQGPGDAGAVRPGAGAAAIGGDTAAGAGFGGDTAAGAGFGGGTAVGAGFGGGTAVGAGAGTAPVARPHCRQKACPS